MTIRPKWMLAFACVCHQASAAANVDAATLNGKVLVGYQGWFNCPGDGSTGNWRSWSRGAPSAETFTVDLYPDLRELGADELCAAPGLTIGGKPAYFYSAWNRKTVARHFQWMKQYGIDGVLAQRFVTNIARFRAGGDVVLKNIMAGAAETGRTFAIEYDVSGANPQTLAQTLKEDWQYLVDDLKVTVQPTYQRHNGRPVVSIWGIGLDEPNHPPEGPADAMEIIDWFRTKAPETYRVTYMGGTPARWRSLTADARKDAEWSRVYQSMDVVQPWTVGRYRDAQTADRWKEQMLEPDLALVARNKQLYMPVIFPGFSWHNLKPASPPNQIPRNRGEFLWRQAYNSKMAGATMLKIAMFDEVNEGTAIFKAASHRSEAPDQGFWLTLDADGADLPSDWYLRLAGEITRMFHGETAASAKMPENPAKPAR